jgi:hypothetical protein
MKDLRNRVGALHKIKELGEKQWAVISPYIL